MAETHALSALNAKRNAIENTIATYEKRLAEARRDLAHISATIQLFSAAEAGDVKPYMDVHRLFKRGEIVTLCKAALAAHGPLDTRELSHAVMKAKGFADDTELRKAIAFKIVQALTMQAKRGTIGDGGKRKNVRLWCLIRSSDQSLVVSRRTCGPASAS